MKNNKSFQTPSSKPNDVTYRLTRLKQTLTEADMFLRAIDPAVFPEQHSALTDLLTRALDVGSGLTAPAKRPRASTDEKAQAAAVRKLAKEQAAAAKAASKAAAAAAKPAKVSKPVAVAVAMGSTPPTGGGSNPMSAIDRALAAAKARRAAQETV